MDCHSEGRGGGSGAKIDAGECRDRGYFRRLCRNVGPMLADLVNETSILNRRKGSLQDENKRGWTGTDKRYREARRSRIKLVRALGHGSAKIHSLTHNARSSQLIGAIRLPSPYFTDNVHSRSENDSKMSRNESSWVTDYSFTMINIIKDSFAMLA